MMLPPPIHRWHGSATRAVLASEFDPRSRTMEDETRYELERVGQKIQYHWVDSE